MEVNIPQQNTTSEDFPKQTIQNSIDASKHEKTCETVTLQLVNNDSTFEREECRICLEGNQEQSLIQCCSCKGSVRLVHRTCLTTWIEKKLQNVSSEAQDIRCELCHRVFNYKLSTTKKWECGQFARHWESKKFRIVVSLIFNTLVLAGFVWFNTVAFTGQNQINRKIQKIEQLKIITIILMIIWAFFILIIFHSFINSYFMKIIKKPIIEDKLIYRVIVIKKNANSITKI